MCGRQQRCLSGGAPLQLCCRPRLPRFLLLPCTASQHSCGPASAQPCPSFPTPSLPRPPQAQPSRYLPRDYITIASGMQALLAGGRVARGEVQVRCGGAGSGGGEWVRLRWW